MATDASEWKVEQLRLTGFPSPSAAIDPARLWKELVGELPESDVSKPRVGERHLEGSIELPSVAPGKLILVTHANRIDWVLTTAEDEQLGSASAEIPNLGKFAHVAKKFTEFTQKWFELSTCPAMHRLAFGVVLVSQVVTRTDGYEKLGKLLPIKIDPEGSSDFLYRINRPRDAGSSFSGLKINRLSRWSVMAHAKRTIEFTPGSVKVSPREPDIHACRLELDINTPYDYEGEFQREKLGVLLATFIRLAMEISEQGDVP